MKRESTIGTRVARACTFKNDRHPFYLGSAVLLRKCYISEGVFKIFEIFH